MTTTRTDKDILPVLIVGAGPTGLPLLCRSLVAVLIRPDGSIGLISDAGAISSVLEYFALMS